MQSGLGSDATSVQRSDLRDAEPDEVLKDEPPGRRRPVAGKTVVKVVRRIRPPASSGGGPGLRRALPPADSVVLEPPGLRRALPAAPTGGVRGVPGLRRNLPRPEELESLATAERSSSSEAKTSVSHAAPLLPPAPPPGRTGEACYEVAGRVFKLPAKLVRAKPDTMLAKLLAKAEGGDPQRPIPLDVCPDRFHAILDWFRYGEMFLSRNHSVEALLRDAARLDLPEEVTINGIVRSTNVKQSAHKVGRTLVANVVSRWKDFNEFFSSILTAIEDHFQSVALQSSRASKPDEVQDAVAEEAFDFPRFVVQLFGEEGWLTPKQVCSAARARVLALKLEELGYECEFTDSDLVVGLPLHLQSEVSGNAAGSQEEPEEPQEEAAENGQEEVSRD